MLSCLGPLVNLLPKTFTLFGFPIIQFWASTEEGYYSNVLCAPNLISTFLLHDVLNLYLECEQCYHVFTDLPCWPPPWKMPFDTICMTVAKTLLTLVTVENYLAHNYKTLTYFLDCHHLSRLGPLVVQYSNHYIEQ